MERVTKRKATKQDSDSEQELQGSDLEVNANSIIRHSTLAAPTLTTQYAVLDYRHRL